MDAHTYFDTVAPVWNDMRKGFFGPALREKAIDVAGLPPRSLAADIGAGAGFITEALVSRGVTVIAVDRSQNMLRELGDRFREVDCRRGSAEALPVDDGAVDAAFANMYLHHVDTPAAAILEMARIVRPGGRVVITDLDSHDFTFLREEHYDRWMGFSREDVAAWFAAAGLENVSVDCAGENCCASSGDGRAGASVSIFIAVGVKPMKGNLP